MGGGRPVYVKPGRAGGAGAFEGDRSRQIYLPVGAAWTDVWSGQQSTGGQTITADAPLERIPLYLRDGAKPPIRA